MTSQPIDDDLSAAMTSQDIAIYDDVSSDDNSIKHDDIVKDDDVASDEEDEDIYKCDDVIICQFFSGFFIYSFFRTILKLQTKIKQM